MKKVVVGVLKSSACIMINLPCEGFTHAVPSAWNAVCSPFLPLPSLLLQVNFLLILSFQTRLLLLMTYFRPLVDALAFSSAPQYNFN